MAVNNYACVFARHGSASLVCWIYNIQTRRVCRVASCRVLQIQIVNGRRDATFDRRDARDATRRNLSVEPEAVHVAPEVAP